MKEIKDQNFFDSFEIVDIEEKLEFCQLFCSNGDCGCADGACHGGTVNAGCACNAGCGCEVACMNLRCPPGFE